MSPVLFQSPRQSSRRSLAHARTWRTTPEHLLHWIADRLDRSRAMALAVLLLCLVPYTVLKAMHTLLRMDEIYTRRIAQQPTAGQVFAVSRQIDLHPPLHYFAERLALSAHLPVLLAARLPSLLATACTLCLVFWFVRRRLGTLMGFCAGSALWFSPAMDFAWSNRPYALWLCLLALCCLLWQRAGEMRRPAWLVPALAISVAAMLMDYMAGLVCVLPLLAAEWLRRRGRRPDLAVLAALLLPCAGAVLYARQVGDFAHNSFAAAYLHWFATAAATYLNLLAVPVGALIACALVSAALAPVCREEPYQDGRAGMPAAEITLACGLLLLPLLLATLAAVRHTQFFERYGACGTVGVALLLPAVLTRYARWPRGTAALFALGLLCGSIVRLNDALTAPPGVPHADVTGVAPLRLSQLDPRLPLVVAQPSVYTEMNEREPADILDRTYYLYDRAAAQRFSGSTLFEGMTTTQRLLHYRTQAAPFAAFTGAHHSFYLIADYTHPEAWLPRALMNDGATLRYLGKFASSYDADDLYLVTIH